MNWIIEHPVLSGLIGGAIATSIIMFITWLCTKNKNRQYRGKKNELTDEDRDLINQWNRKMN